MSFNDYASTPGDVGSKSRCYSEKLALAIPANIRNMKSYVDGLVPYGKKQSKFSRAQLPCTTTATYQSSLVVGARL